MKYKVVFDLVGRELGILSFIIKFYFIYGKLDIKGVSYFFRVFSLYFNFIFEKLDFFFFVLM